MTKTSHFRDFHGQDSQTCTYSLQADAEYLFVLFHTQGGGLGHLTLAVEVEGADSAKPNTRRRTHKLSVRNSPVRQKLQFDVVNATGGTFSLLFSVPDPSSSGSLYSREVTDIDFNAPADVVSTKLRNALGADNSVVRETLDAGGNPTQDGASIAKYRWTVTFEEHRPYPVAPTLDGSGLQASAPSNGGVVSLVEQSAPVAGSFQIAFGDSDQTVTIDYNASADSLKRALQNSFDALAEGVDVYTKGASADGRSWFITVHNAAGNTDEFKVVKSLLVGGASDATTAKPLAVDSDPDHVPASNNLVYLPVPSEFLRSVHTHPQVVVKVGDLLAGCEDKVCDVAFVPEAELPEITGFSLGSDNLFEFQVALPAPGERRLLQGTGSARLLQQALTSRLKKEDLRIFVGPTECGSIAISADSITCEVELNANAKPKLEAGSHIGRIHQRQKGYFKPSADTYTHPLEITDYFPKAVSANGGTLLTIRGNGFVFEKKQSSNVVTVGGEKCQIEASSNTEVTCLGRADWPRTAPNSLWL